MIVSIVHDWPQPWPHVLAAPSPVPRSRRSAPWSAPDGRTCCPTGSERHTAFAVEAVADEAVFVSGPALVTFLSTLCARRSPDWRPPSSLGTVGTLGLAAAARHRTAGAPARTRPRRRGRRCPGCGWCPLTLGAAALGSLFGATEVATVAFADENGPQGALRPDARRVWRWAACSRACSPARSRGR